MCSPDVIMTEGQWKEVTEPLNATKKIQMDIFAPGSFYMEWTKLLYRVAGNPIILTYKFYNTGILANNIVISMKRREKLLLDNDILLADIYVGAMYRATLTDAQIDRAKTALCGVAI